MTLILRLFFLFAPDRRFIRPERPEMTINDLTQLLLGHLAALFGLGTLMSGLALSLVWILKLIL